MSINPINASAIPCDILYRPTDPRYAESIRQYQGCPTIAVTHGKRIFLGWYSGGITEPHIDNYNLLIYSDDEGKTWSSPLLVIPSSRELGIHALDIQLWTDPRGFLHVYWVQNRACPKPDVLPEKQLPDQPLIVIDGWLFDDFAHNEWEIVCENPDDDNPVFSEPRRLDQGFLRCKPVVLADGTWMNFNYDQMTTRYGYSTSTDEGKTFTRHYGAEKIGTYFDECMAYQKTDGTIRMMARCRDGQLAESRSYDNGATWTPAELNGITAADTRFFLSRTPSGRVLLITNDDPKIRRNMTISLSDDDGATWKYRRCIDTRAGISYPDADFRDGYIYMTYDRERTGAKEIFFLRFTEEDIMDESVPLVPQIVSKP